MYSEIFFLGHGSKLKFRYLSDFGEIRAYRLRIAMLASCLGKALGDEGLSFLGCSHMVSYVELCVLDFGFERDYREENAIPFSSGDMARESVDAILSRAKVHETEYDWLGAATLYRDALSSVSGKDAAGAARIRELLAYALFKAAFQADRQEDFRSRLENSISAYGEALEAYSGMVQPKTVSLTKRCEAMVAFLKYWQASDQRNKKRLIGVTWRLSDAALRGFEETDDHEELCPTFHQLALSAALAFNFEDDPKNREEILKNAVDHADEAVRLVRSLESTRLQAAVYAISATFIKNYGWLYRGLWERGQFVRRAEEHWMKAVNLSKEQAILELSHFATFGLQPFRGLDEVMAFLGSALGECQKTQDKLLIGCVHELLARAMTSKGTGVEDIEARKASLDESLRFAREAKNAFSSISHVSPSGWDDVWVEVPEGGYYATLVFLEKDPKKKRGFAEKGMPFVRRGLKIASDSCFPDLVWLCQDTLDHVLVGLAETETDPAKKAELLREAIAVRTESLRSLEKYFPMVESWRGWWHGPLGHAKLELAGLETDPVIKEELLKESIRCEEIAVEAAEKASSIADQLDAGTIEIDEYCRQKLIDGLRSLYDLTGESKHLERAIEALEAAARSYRRVSMFSRTAECHWKSAMFLDALNEHQEAAEEFQFAADDFKIAAERLPRLRTLFEDSSRYMSAWEAIERARHHHSKQEYAQAKEFYERAANLHESTKKWPFLATNYSVWAKVESAEDLSQKDRNNESIEAFKEASKQLRESEAQLREHLDGIEGPDEKQMVERLIEAVDPRQRLCSARIALEEARVMDKKGRLGEASTKYGLAADMFAKVKQVLPGGQDRTEIELMITLSRAWKAMARAEAESSPELYEEAAQFFDEAKNLSPGEKAKSLALGNSRLSIALAAGARYALISDSALHATAVQSLESAEKYYLKADLRSAADCARASKLLFDSYAYVNRAIREEDQGKKTKLYAMAEKVLQASVFSYEKAGQTGRKEQVLRLLAKVKEDRELAMSLAEVFLAPDIVSTSIAFPSPAPKHETAVGLERFEHADVQVSLIADPTKLQVGQELRVEIEVTNAGRGSAQMARAEGLIPEGFVVVEMPERCRIEGCNMNLRGRRLDSLKTDDFKLVLRPTARGSYKLKPRITYLDESGSYKSCEPVPIDVSVREMGIAGWLRGT
jgi:tetratricopeptide (TPR) repeat protein